jgi:protein involved in polysaccharide export with SLBB domain
MDIMMNSSRNAAGQGLVLAGFLCAALLLAGCGSNKHVFAPLPSDVENVSKPGSMDQFRVGDMVSIAFQGTSASEQLLQPYAETVKEDGTVTPPLVGSIVAAGKTPGELQNALQARYNKLYKRLSVNIVTQNRYYYVSGEVRKPGPEPYLGETDIIKAISAGGDFTDFANRKKVRLTRADGRTEIVNVLRVMEDPQYDVPVYPGDKILVPRRFF